jgi:dipeptidyl aminopeptidase/acylaminoacyl peptidase
LDGSVVASVAQADVSAPELHEWAAPEELVVPAPDELTELHGVMWHPPGFDETGSYPVIELIYAGPQQVFHPRHFRLGEAILAQALARLGFVTITLDGRGTPERGKVFQDVVYGHFGQHEIVDHASALRHLMASRPYLDPARAGIVGGSWGGYMTLRAMALEPDLYRVGVCLYGVGDLMDHPARIIEPYMGDPNENRDGYQEAATLPLLDQLQGKLMLVHGTSDSNAPFSATMKIVNRLIELNKDFDLLVVPEQAHALVGKGAQYVLERVARYFIEHL